MQKVVKKVLPSRRSSTPTLRRCCDTRDVEGPKKTGSMETRLEAMEQQIFKCKEMVERGLNANHMMIMEFTNNHKLDAKNIEETIFKLHEKIKNLQAQI